MRTNKKIIGVPQRFFLLNSFSKVEKLFLNLENPSYKIGSY